MLWGLYLGYFLPYEHVIILVPLVKKNFFFPLLDFTPLSKISWINLCESISVLGFLFCSTDLSVYSLSVLITIALEYNLEI